MIDQVNELKLRIGQLPEEEDRSFLIQSLQLTQELHADILRSDKRSYFIEHLYNVANILFAWSAPKEVIAAGLLHDALKKDYSRNTSLENIKQSLGIRVAEIVKAAWQLGAYEPTQDIDDIDDLIHNTELIENKLPWVLRVIAKEPEAAVIRLAARIEKLNNLVVPLTPSSKKYVETTKNIFIPLANRLGMWSVKRDLEDHVFRLLEPEHYQSIQDRYQVDYEQPIEALVNELQDYLFQSGLSGISIRPELVSRYEIFIYENEHNRYKGNHIFIPILITTTNRNYYDVLGKVHRLWQPEQGQIRDYISVPKNNSYRGLRTVVRISPRKTAIILIRDEEMDLVDEWGLVAKWKGISEDYLTDIQIPPDNIPPFGKIAVFTPKGECIILKEGSSVLDFAYGVHPEIGKHALTADVNYIEAPLDHILQDGDIVNISTDPQIFPSFGWLNIVKTSRAKREINRYFELTYAQKGLELLLSELKMQGIVKDLFFETYLDTVSQKMGYPSTKALKIDIGKNKQRVVQVVTAFQDLQTVHIKPGQEQLIKLAETLDYSFTVCHRCDPKPPAKIYGLITREKQVTIHRENCWIFKRGKQNSPIVEARWNTVQREIKIVLHMVALDREGLVLDVCRVIMRHRFQMSRIQATSKQDGSATIDIGLGGNVTEQSLALLIDELKQIHSMQSVIRQETSTSILVDNSNPYTLRPAEGDVFFGRKEDLSMLSQNLAHLKPGEAVLLWGPRRIGKTSLLRRYSSQTILSSSDYLPVFIDLQELAGGTTAYLLYTIMRGIEKAVRKPEIKAPERHRFLKNPMDYFREFMSLLFQLEHRIPILILDEFERLPLLNDDQQILEDLFAYFRNLIQEKRKIIFIYSGGGLLNQILSRAGASKLLNIVPTQKIDCIQREDAEKLITEPVGWMKFTPKAVERLLNLTGCHPYYLQILCRELFFLHWESIDEMKIDDLKNSLLPTLGDQNFVHLWGDDTGISPLEEASYRLVFVAVARCMNADHWFTAFELWYAVVELLGHSIENLIGEDQLRDWLDDLVDMGTLMKNCENATYRTRFEIAHFWIQKSRWSVRKAFSEYQEVLNKGEKND